MHSAAEELKLDPPGQRGLNLGVVFGSSIDLQLGGAERAHHLHKVLSPPAELARLSRAVTPKIPKMHGLPLHQVYADSMRNHHYGQALYEPESSAVLKPGTCGYLSEDTGSWTPLFNLGNEKSLSSVGLSPFYELQRAPETTRVWGPKVSSDTRAISLDLTASVSAPVLAAAGLPAGVGAVLKFSNDGASGAVLLTDGDVVKDAVYFREPYRIWCKANSAGILRKWPDVKRHGLWVVTETWSAPRVSVNAWHSVSKEVTVGFDVSFTPVGEIGPTSSWRTGTSDSGWVTPKTEDASGRFVVFFGGIFFKYRKLAPVLPQNHALSERKFRFRGQEEFVLSDPEDATSELIVDIAEYGIEETRDGTDQEDDF